MNRNSENAASAARFRHARAHSKKPDILDRVRTWPQERQEEAVRVLIALEESSGIYVLDEEEAADLDAAEEEIRRGEIATDEEVQETFAALRRA